MKQRQQPAYTKIPFFYNSRISMLLHFVLYIRMYSI